MDLVELFNLSINNTLITNNYDKFNNTFSIICLYLLGGQVIKPFAFTMIIGVIVGTYSSIFIAVPTLLLFKFRPHRRRRLLN